MNFPHLSRLSCTIVVLQNSKHKRINCCSKCNLCPQLYLHGIPLHMFNEIPTSSIHWACCVTFCSLIQVYLMVVVFFPNSSLFDGCCTGQHQLTLETTLQGSWLETLLFAMELGSGCYISNALCLYLNIVSIKHFFSGPRRLLSRATWIWWLYTDYRAMLFIKNWSCRSLKANQSPASQIINQQQN